LVGVIGNGLVGRFIRLGDEMTEKFNISVESEIGRLTGVILHSPGQEVANMTPETAERALYSDILNLSVAKEEYLQLHGVLEKRCRVFQIRDLLAEILGNNRVRAGLVRRICEAEEVGDIADSLLLLDSVELSQVLIEGVALVKDNLSRFLSRDRYSLPPLHNLFFTRDAGVVVWDKVLIARMANRVRGREACIVEAIFDFHPLFNARTVNPVRLGGGDPGLTIEGGDIQVAGPEILVIGTGVRTSRTAVDFLIERFKELGKKQHLLVQELPRSPESFIHLDMVFTFLDRNHCMVYEQPLFCGGRTDRWLQEREQWHSGANFFALAPGQVIGYGRNEHTIAEFEGAGFIVISAKDVIAGKADLDQVGRCVVTIDGSELARGGGGCRCMTLPIGREPIVG
jgi:arginine deiminase